MSWYDDCNRNSKFIKIPVGERVQLHIRSIEKDEDGDPKFQLSRDHKPIGHSYKITTMDDKTYNMNSWPLVYEMAKFKIDKGDLVEIYHRAKGLWEVEKIEDAKEHLHTTAEDVPF